MSTQKEAGLEDKCEAGIDTWKSKYKYSAQQTEQTVRSLKIALHKKKVTIQILCGEIFYYIFDKLIFPTLYWG